MKDRFLRACRREPVDTTPIWFMRQAGRYMAEYRKLREKHSLLEICKEPDLATEVTLQPLRLGVDAAILFADILLPLEPMGAPFEFAKGEGPVIHEPITSRAQIDKLRVIDPEDGLGYILESLRSIKRALPSENGVKLPLIGFAGAPFTLASYLIEGGKSAHFAKTKRMMYAEPDAWNALMGKLAEVVRKYLRAQLLAGADCVQLFDSWVGQLSPDDYRQYILPHVTHILKDLEATGAPVIHFGTGTHTLLPLQREAGGTVLGLDWRTPLADGWKIIGHDRACQGNLDPTVLFAPRDIAIAHAKRVLDAAGGRAGHIFNLGHGILPETPVDTVKAIADFVHEEGSKPAMHDGIVLIGHGTVESLDELPDFLTNIRRGHPPPAELLAEVRRRYEAIGGKSPLNDVSRRLAAKVEAILGVPVRLAMRMWKPYAKEVLAGLAENGALRVAVVPLAQHSAHLYGETVRDAATAIAKDGGKEIAVVAANNWGGDPNLLDAYAARVRAALDEVGAARWKETCVVMTAHSLPVAIVRGGDPYEDEVRKSADAVAARLEAGGANVATVMAFQSQGMSTGPGGRPMEWLGPDLKTTLGGLAKTGTKQVVFAPIGFLADHVETMYDLDIEARGWCQELGLGYARSRALDDDDALAHVLASVARHVLDGAAGSGA